MQSQRSEEQGEGRAMCDTAVLGEKKEKKKELGGDSWWSIFQRGGVNEAQSYSRHQTTYTLTEPQIDPNGAIYV